MDGKAWVRATLDFPLTDVQVFHTDRGSGFDNTGIDEPLDVFGIKRSLSRKGNPYDNAVVESTPKDIPTWTYINERISIVNCSLKFAVAMAICPARKRFWHWPLPYG